MTDKERMLRVLNASPEMLRKIDDILMDRVKWGFEGSKLIDTVALIQ